MAKVPSFSGGLFSQAPPALAPSGQQPDTSDRETVLPKHLEMVTANPFQFDGIQQSFLHEFNPQNIEDYQHADIGLTAIARTAGFSAVEKMPYEADPDLFPVDDADWERMSSLRQLNIDTDETLYQVDELELEKFQKERMESLKTASLDSPLSDNSGLTPKDMSQLESLDKQEQRPLGTWKDQLFEGELSDTELLTAYESGRLNLKEYQSLSQIADKIHKDPEKTQVVNSLLESSGLGRTDPMRDIVRNSLLEADNPVQALSTNLNIVKEAKKEQNKIAYQSSKFLKVPVNKLTAAHLDDGKHSIRNSFASGNLEFKAALQELQKINGVNI